MKKLGFGLMRLPLLDPADEGSVDIPKVCEMTDMFLSRGFTYFDTAWMYQNFRSEEVAREALVKRHPRDSFTLATKLHAGFFDSREGCDKVFFEQLKKTGVEYFDYYLLHGIEGSSLEKFEQHDCFEWLLKKKEEGLVRHAGFSYHDNAAILDDILTRHPQMEFVQLQLNYLDWTSPWVQSKDCHEVAVRHGKPIVVMEPVKGGTLAKIPPKAEELFRKLDPEATPASWAIRFAASLENVMVVLSGMSDMAQMEDNLKTMEEFRPLSEEEKKICFEAAAIINGQTAVPCTSCHYCTEGCPKHIAIPEYFSLYNEDMREDLEEKGWTVSYSTYDHLAEKHGRAQDCIECGRCEKVCPQHISIINELKAVSAHFDHTGS